MHYARVRCRGTKRQLLETSNVVGRERNHSKKKTLMKMQNTHTHTHTQVNTLNEEKMPSTIE